MRALGCSIMLALLAACAGPDGATSSIRAARIVADPAPTLEADLDLRFSSVMLEALDRGIPLQLVIEVLSSDSAPKLHVRRHLQLRHLPLARRYASRDLETGAERTFTRRTQLLASLDRVRLSLPNAWAALRPGSRVQVYIALDANSLPGPLRLPALFLSEWRVLSTELAWQTAG